VKVAVLAVAVAVALISAAPARAGTYEIQACGSAGVNRSWVAENSSPAAFVVKATCPMEVLTHSPDNVVPGFFQAAGWHFKPPQGTVADRLRIVRYGYRFLDRNDNGHQGGWLTEGRTEDSQIAAGFAVEACRIADDAYLCDFGSQNGSGPAADWDIDATDVVYQVVCVRSSGGCDTAANNFPLAGVTIFSAIVTVRDDTAPNLSATGGPLAPGWHRPSEPITVTATDASGIASVTASATGSGQIVSPCDFTRNPPCPNTNGQLTLTNTTDGTQPLTITVKDPAGNPTSLTRAVDIDGNAPFANLQDTRRTIAVKVTDEASGVQSGQVEVRNGSNEAYRALPTTLKHGRLTANGNPRADIRVTVTDNAGNQATGVPARFAAPAHRRVRFGHATTLRGRLTLSAGQPLRGVAIQATATIRGHAAQPAGATATDARGRFKLRIAAGPSRTVRLVFPGAGQALRSVRAVGIRVPASSTIHASRRAVRGAQRVAFSGRIRTAGQPIPRGGLLVVLQGRSLGHWRTFADLRTTASGRWHASYRFHGRPGRYPVRLRIRRQQGFPFELGYSRSATVTVR